MVTYRPHSWKDEKNKQNVNWNNKFKSYRDGRYYKDVISTHSHSHTLTKYNTTLMILLSQSDSLSDAPKPVSATFSHEPTSYLGCCCFCCCCCIETSRLMENLPSCQDCQLSINWHMHTHEDLAKNHCVGDSKGNANKREETQNGQV